MAGRTTLTREARLDWYGDQVKRTVFEVSRRRVVAAVAYFKKRVISNLSVPVGTITGPRGGITKIRSKPGEFPRKDTGELIRTLDSGIVILPGGIWDGWVGTPLDYGLYLEVGTRKMAARPWLTRTLYEEQAAITAILTAPIR